MIIKNLLQGLNVGKVLKTVTSSIDKKTKVKAISIMGGGGAVVLAGIELFYVAIEQDSSIAFWSGVITLVVGAVMAIMLGGVINDVEDGSDK